MAEKKLSRKELLKGSDEFFSFSTRAADFFSRNMRQVQFIGLAVAVIAVLYLAVNAYLGYVNGKGQDAYNAAYETLAESLKPDANKESLGKSGDLFEKVIDEYAMSRASRLALPQVAYVKFAQKEYDEAIALYRKFSDKVSGDNKYKFLADLALSACFEAKGEFKKAIEVLKTIEETPDVPFHETALLSLSRLYRLENKPEKAEEILKIFVEKYKDSPFLPMAKARL